LLGIRLRAGHTVFDPVLPEEYGELRVTLRLHSRSVTIVYHAGTDRVGPLRLRINGIDQEFTREDNPYRRGGALLDNEVFTRVLNHDSNTIELYF
jgi:cellobiose phosphorylase